MVKKILLTLASAAVVVAGVVALSAGEAHIINVTATLENALTVSPDALAFGTVFPQEILHKDLTVGLSESFRGEVNVDDVNYKIVQKPKCSVDGQNPPYYPVDRKTHLCPEVKNDQGNLVPTQPLPALCPFLSKTPLDPDNGDTGVAAPHPWVWPDDGSNPIAHGKLLKPNDVSDVWDIDLHVPCFTGMCAQDYPAGAPTLDPKLEHKVFGCDLWVESNGVSR